MLQKIKDEIPLTFHNNRKFLVQFYAAIGDFSAEQIRPNIQKEEVADVEEVTMEECFDLIRNSKTRFPYVGNEEKFEEVFRAVMQVYQNFEKERSIKER